VEAAKCINNLSRVYSGPRLIELPLLSQISKKFATVQEINDKVQLCFRLKSEMKPNDVRIFYFL
jgi:hypothetical protein